MTLTTIPDEEHDTRTQPPLWARQDGPWVPRRRHVFWGIVVAVLAVATTVFIIQRAQGAHYEATIQQITPWGSSQLFVTVQVRNLGGTAATPTCRVDINSPVYAYSGTATVSGTRPIGADSTATYEVIVPVTDGGATHISFNTSNVDCR